MRRLVLDTSTDRASVVLGSEEGVFAAHTEDLAGRHGEGFMAVIARVLGEASLTPGDLDSIAVATGPGSFTGLRLGVTTAKGLAWALSVPLVGFSTLRAWARAMPADDARGLRVALLDAKKGEVYAAAYDAVMAERLAPCCVSPEALLQTFGLEARFTGTGVDAHPGAFQGRSVAVSDAELAAARLAEAMAAHPVELHALVPTYVRGADVTVRGKTIRVD